MIKATALDLNHWLVIIALAFMVIPVDLVRKAVDTENKEVCNMSISLVKGQKIDLTKGNAG